MNIMLLAGVQQLLPAPSTSPVLLMLLALGSFLARLNLASLELCFLGLVLALAVPAVSWVKQSMLFVILAGAFVVEPQGKSGNSHRRIGADLPRNGRRLRHRRAT